MAASHRRTAPAERPVRTPYGGAGEVTAGGDPQEPGARSFATCLASLLELAVDDIPLPTTAVPRITWGQWLAERGLGLVRVADPGTFAIAGHWIGVLEDGTAVVMFGVPSGPVWDPLGRTAMDTSIPLADGFVLTPFELRAAAPLPRTVTGTVRALFVAPEAEVAMRSVQRVRALPGQGPEGDRYARGEGTFSVAGGRGNEVTLIEAEALIELARLDCEPLAAADARRNVLTEGIDLNALIGRRFRVGDVELIGRRRCEPCAHLQRLTRPGVLRALVHRGGLRADLLTPGVLAVGDLIETVETT